MYEEATTPKAGDQSVDIGISASRSSEGKSGGAETSVEQLIPNLWLRKVTLGAETRKSRKAALPIGVHTSEGHNKAASGSSPNAGAWSQRLAAGMKY